MKIVVPEDLTVTTEVGTFPVTYVPSYASNFQSFSVTS